MRQTGIHRGNPTVRFMVTQSARRRMYASLRPETAILPAAPDSRTLRWSREFFERLHATLLPQMATVAEVPEGVLRYHGSQVMKLWALVSPHATALAYDFSETPETIRERASRWVACLTTRTAPGLASPHWGNPVYGARLDPLSGELDVVWANPGDWCDVVLHGALPAREHDRPLEWSAGVTA
jgi:hypothetical protein